MSSQSTDRTSRKTPVTSVPRLPRDPALVEAVRALMAGRSTPEQFAEFSRQHGYLPDFPAAMRAIGRAQGECDSPSAT